MILTLLLAVLACAALLPIVLPLLRGTGRLADGAAFDQAVYRDQLRELDRDIARGVLTPDEVQASRVEIQRRLLAAAARSGSGGSPVGSPPVGSPLVRPLVRPRVRPAPFLALAVIAVTSIGSISLYALLAEPARLPNPVTEQHAEVERLAQQLRERLAKEPDSQEGWRLYGRTMAALADWPAAIEAYQRAIALGDASADTRAALGEVFVARAGGSVVPPARAAFGDALAVDPAHGMARYYLALATGQDGNPKDAIEALLILAADVPAESPARAAIARQVALLAQQAGMAPPALPGGPLRESGPDQGPDRGPDQATMEAAAALPPADRARMVRDMVARLAERLEASPDDPEGWLRLARSYGVLGENDKSADAYERAASLRPGDVTIPLRAVEALLTGRSVTDALPERAIAIVRRIETGRPDEPAVLWYLGLVAAHDGQKARALEYWYRLLKGLPANHPDAGMVRSAIEALEGGRPAR